MNKLDIEQIIENLPHRYPFLLVDRVLEMVERERIIAIKNVTVNEPFFAGHFPGKKVMPGVMIVESLAQASGILAYTSSEWQGSESLFYLGSIDNTKFKKIVTPGDQLRLEVEVLKRRKTVWKFAAKAFVDGELVCSSEMTCAEGKIN